jgi:hypothetical protein
MMIKAGETGIRALATERVKKLDKIAFGGR